MTEPVQKSSYKNLIVYQKAKTLTTDIIKYFSEHKLPYTTDFLIKQLLRSISSIGANIAEGYGRYYQGSLRQFYAIARGSSFESDYWLEILQETGKFDEKKISDFINRNTELSKMLTSLMKKTEVSRS